MVDTLRIPLGFAYELDELSSLKQWVCREGKIPKNPNNPGANAKSNDPSTWSDYPTAYSAYQNNPSYDGVGFQFGVYEPGLRVAGIDLDHVVQEDGSLSQLAQEIVEYMDSYTEYSPSGTGLHILCYVDLPAIGNKRSFENGEALEMYNHSRYFTVTFNVYDRIHGRALADRTEKFKKLHETFFSKPEPKITQQPSVQKQYLQLQSTPNDLTDDELLSKMFASRNGYEIQKLWNGNISSYDNDDSRADLALFQHLLFWTGRDEIRADQLFRQSGLMRPKWNRADYRNRTIEAALNSQLGVYDRKYGLQSTVFDSSNPQSVPAQSSESVSIATEQADVDDALLPVVTLESYLQEGGGCDQDYERFMQSKDRKTGFSNLDEQIGNLYPGLYVLGAISSLGKTTFACQLADQLSHQGEHVLYFSLEQSKYELVAKGLARLIAASKYQLSKQNSNLPNFRSDDCNRNT